ncbi:S41 family peptidase [Lactobacillus sp. DCY120]|uniref:S41 family peptidase n=1 Tax=Bombilactobacillus apium TaxID=2675299 RepID=A0A850R093_9LACO|nr:S41 family peptidase [Bombilactobacillus apium]NVY95770.1 S41 family peptidase [Bombilactobacillus apium]
MKRKFSGKFVLGVSVLSLLLGSALTFAFVALKLLSSSSAPLNSVTEAYQNIMQNYYQPVKSQQLVNGAIQGMLDTLDDPYSQLLTSQNQTDFDESISGKISGIGATIEQNGDQIQIVSAMPHSPAAKAGLKARDQIQKINQHSTKKMTVRKASQLTRGKQGTKVVLTIKRQDRTFTKTLRRAPIQVATVHGELTKQNSQVGQVTITQFSEKTATELKREIQKLQRKGARKLVIDVRNNPGGVMDQAIAAASLFVPNGKAIMTITDRAGEQKTYRAAAKYLGGTKIKLPTVVLVDGGSASAAEIFAAALHESAQIPLVGEKTYGKGVVQTVNSLGAKSEMKITTAKWLTPKKHWINHRGIEPTDLVKYPAYMNLTAFKSQKTLTAGANDADIQRAQKVLKALDYSLSVTGTLDATTVQVLRDFQSKQKITVNGKLDLATRQALTQALVKKAQAQDPMLQKAQEILTAK